MLKISTQSKMYFGNLDTMFLQMRMAILQTLIMIAATCPVDRRSFFHLSQSMLKGRAIGALRYFIKLPKSVLGYREITTETLFGFNAVINDADFDTRETVSVFTKGLGESKNPSLAYTFRLLSGASDAANNSDVKAAVPE